MWQTQGRGLDAVPDAVARGGFQVLGELLLNGRLADSLAALRRPLADRYTVAGELGNWTGHGLLGSCERDTRARVLLCSGDVQDSMESPEG